MRYYLSILIVVLALRTFGQKSEPVSFAITPMYGSELLVLNDTSYTLSNGETIRFTMLRFYLSNIRLYNGSKLIYSEKKSYHLVDAENADSWKIVLPNTAKLTFTHLEFDLGIDSVTNVSGAMGGDLDPTKGMYWTWQSGYINFKLEGVSTLCPTRKNEFQFHLGGYAAPFSSKQKIQLQVDKKKQLEVELNIQKLIETIDLTKQHTIMSPSVEAQVLAKLVASEFKLK